MAKSVSKGITKGSARSVERRSALRMDERGRQVIRFLDVLRALENTRRGLTVKELVDQLELTCDPRTVYRDLEHLKRAGFDVVEEDSRYRIEGPSIKSEPLTDSQVLAVLLAADFLSPLSGFGVEREFLVLRDSLRARLTPEKRKWVDVLRGLVAVRRQLPQMQVPEGMLDQIADALGQEQVLEIEYAAPNKKPERRLVEPYLLWCHQGSAYLVAKCRTAKDFRIFKLVRLRAARMLEATFERDEAFDAQEFVDRGFGAYHGESIEVEVRFSPEVAHLAREKVFHPSQEVNFREDGAADLRFTAAGLPEMAAWVASFGGKVRVLAPFELRSAVRDIHEAGLRECENAGFGDGAVVLSSDVKGRE